MSFSEMLDRLMSETIQLQDDLQSRKENDVDSLVQINGKIKQLGSEINGFLELDDHCGKDDDKHSALVQELLSLYETLTQELDEIAQVNEDVKSQVKIQSQKSQLSSKLCSSWMQKPINECSDFEYLHYINILEDTSVEFKNYSLDSIRSKQSRDILKKTIVSFLNRQGGSIYLGIRDDTMVVGLNLSLPQMDMLKRKIISIKNDIIPQIGEKVRVEFMPLRQGQQWMSARWVVRVRVDQGELDTLYSFDNSANPYLLESYYREDGAVIRYKIADFIAEKIDILNNRNNKRWKEKPIKFAAPHKEGQARCMRQPIKSELEAQNNTNTRSLQCLNQKCSCGHDKKQPKEEPTVVKDKINVQIENDENSMINANKKQGVQAGIQAKQVINNIKPIQKEIIADKNEINNQNNTKNILSGNSNNSNNNGAIVKQPKKRFGQLFHQIVYGQQE